MLPRKIMLNFEIQDGTSENVINFKNHREILYLASSGMRCAIPRSEEFNFEIRDGSSKQCHYLLKWYFRGIPYVGV